ncbi:hypothetical protein HUJ05_000224 [Dendroctonus ponderosae]|nr:hypothetical protein HUJ05_000224 [Dendroctonus ponderosae]
MLITIPDGCQIGSNNKILSNDVKIQEEKQLLLLAVILATSNFTKVLETQSITEINFEEIHQLQNMANYLAPPIGYNPDSTQSDWSWILFIIIVVVFFTTLAVKKKTPQSIWRSWRNNRKGVQEEAATTQQPCHSKTRPSILES